MKESEIIEGNKLIAEFMGAKWSKSSGYEFSMFASAYSNCGKTLKFYSSWDWLMPVVEKIENIAQSQKSDSFFLSYIRNNYTIFDMKLTEVSIAAVWIKTVYFIDWYNSQSK